MMRYFICLLWMSVFLFADGLKQIESFHAHFVQTLRSEDGKIIQYQGEVYAKTPYFGKWIYKKPIEKEVFLSEKMVIIFEPMLEQAIISSLKEEVNFFTLLAHATLLGPNMYQSMVLGQTYFLETKDGIIQKIRFEDGLLNAVEIAFMQIEVNIPIDEAQFEFHPSSAIDMIYQ